MFAREQQSQFLAQPTYKDMLHRIFDYEECQIDSKESRRLRKVINELCTTENEFLTYFEMVEDDIQEVKEKKLKL